MAVLEIWNRALSVARARGRLSTLTEASPEQEVLDQWYPFVLRVVQSAVWWPSCKAQARLALVSAADGDWEEGQPEFGYAYGYALPANMLRPWHLTDFSRFSLGHDLTRDKQILSSNSVLPILTYSVLQENTARWSPLQENATVYALAAHITGPLTGKNSLTRENMQMANQYLLEAQAASANDMGDFAKPQVPWLQARGYGATEQTRYYFPTGELFANA